MFKKTIKVTKVFEICNAYETGYGHGYQQDGKNRDYSDSDLNKAYKYGYDIGFDKRVEETNAKS